MTETVTKCASTTEDICGTTYTISWVLQQIKTRTGVTDAKLKEYQETRIGVGQGYLSYVIRLNLVWEEGADVKLPTIVVLKVPTVTTITAVMDELMDGSSEEQTTALGDDMMDFIPLGHNNECASYEIMSKTEHPDVKVPYVYGWRRMTKTDEPGALLMEDFSARNAAVVNKADGLTLGQVETLVDSLANMYAWSIECDQSFRTAFQVNEDMLDKWQDNMLPMYKQFITMYPETFTEDDLITWAMSGDYARVMFGLNANAEKVFNLPTAMVHGDMWTNNFLFKRVEGDDEKISDDLFAIIDWQTAHTGLCVEDVTRMLLSSTPPAMRHKHKDALIQRLFDKSTARLKSTPSFTVADLHVAYDFCVPFSTIFFVVSLGFMMENPMIVGEPGTEVNKRRVNAMLDRAKAALDDSKEVKQHVSDLLKKMSS